LSAFFLLIAIALILAACGGSTPPLEPTLAIRAEGNTAIEAAQPPAEPTPTPNIEATAGARIRATLAAMPTTTPVLRPTPSSNISAVEAKERLRLHFERVSERDENWSRYKKGLDSGMYNPIPPGCDPIAIFYPPGYERCPEWHKQIIEAVALEESKEKARPRSAMIAEYQGQGTWLITIQGEHLFHPVLRGERFEEEWWLFESGDTPPTKRTVQ
jgi:hypothetical protein